MRDVIGGNSMSLVAQKAGVDVGGTFTDLVAIQDGVLCVSKRLSTPDDPVRGIVDGLGHLGIDRAADIVHGSTVATNAILERKGARTALITTAGFRDVLEIGRQNRPILYSIEPIRPEPLVGSDDRYEAMERVDYQGRIIRELDEEHLCTVLAELKTSGVESCAVCLLFSFLNPIHEQRIRDLLHEAGFNFVSLSSDIIPEFREYERTSTVCLNAYVEPIMSAYLQKLAASAAGSLWIVQSNGGLLRADEAAKEPVRTVLSGPAGGVIGALETARRLGLDNIVTFDMGGTSTDVALCPGRPLMTNQGVLGGFPISIGMIDIHTVGAGGGSLAYLDEGGAVRVGPESAGANPGPASYDRGGLLPTVTDANLILGRLPTTSRFGESFSLNKSSAEAAIGDLVTQIPALSDLDVNDAIRQSALAIVDLANTNMESALRLITVERGYDPREFTLVAFGGAGPLHACDLAERLHIPRVLVPRHPGVLSAIGCLTADRIRVHSRTLMVPASKDHLSVLHSVVLELEAAVCADLKFESSDPDVQRFLDMRYRGQSYELTVPWVDATLDTAIESFHEEHERRYGYSGISLPVEIVSIRIVGTIPSPGIPDPASDCDTTSQSVTNKVSVTFPGGEEDAVLLRREELGVGVTLDGPAILTQSDCTTVIPPGWHGSVIEGLSIMLTPRSD